MKSNLCVWHRGEDGQLAALVADHPIWFAHHAPVPSEQPQENAVAVHAVSSPSGVIGAALVPDDLDSSAALNGVPLRAGLHVLRHTDRLDLNEHSVWFAAQSTCESTTYDPEVHGENVFCYLTKARLETGQAIVVCPAAPGKTCNAIYKQRSWELAMKSTTMRKCANCGYRPDDAEWKPSVPRPRKKIDELLHSLTDGHV